MLRRTALASLLVLLSATGPALSQTGDSVIIGTIVNAETRHKLPDVVVTATSPSLQGEQTVVTDSDGGYRIPQLPAGIYTLRMEADGYKPYTRGNVALQENQTIRVNAELLPNSLSATK